MARRDLWEGLGRLGNKADDMLERGDEVIT